MALNTHDRTQERLLPWKGAVVTWIRGEWPDLTSRQLALLMIVALEHEQHTVGGLAVQLGLSPPIVSRILDRLAQLGLIARRADRRDRRTVFVDATERGHEFLEEFGSGLRSDQ